jgi:hypothetical protein
MIGNFANKMAEYQGNDIIMPKYDPTSLGVNFESDMALTGLVKYLRGL